MPDLSNWVYNLAHFLQSQGVGTLGTSLWIGSFPEASSSGVCVISTGGFPSIKATETCRPTVQITCRAKAHQDAFSKAADIYDLLNEAPHRVYNSQTKVLYSKALQPPFQIAKQDVFFTIVCNYTFWLT